MRGRLRNSFIRVSLDHDARAVDGIEASRPPVVALPGGLKTAPLWY